jgi:subtilase family serine protease
MASFNPADYETVAERIARFYKDFPDGRIVTKNITQAHDRAISTWVVQAWVYLSSEDQARGLPKATGLAFEIDGAGMANKTSALENAETSAIGRSLANANYSGDKRVTREEMNKVNRGVTPSKNYMVALENINDIEGLRSLYNEAKQNKVPSSILEAIKGKADGISNR